MLGTSAEKWMGLKQGLTNVKNAVVNGPGGEINDLGLVILFLLALAAHIIDFFTRYDRNPGFLILGLYLLILAIAYFFVFNRHIGSDEGTLLIVIGISYVLPFAADWFTESKFMIALSGVIFLIPLLPLFIAFKFPDNALINKIARWYMLFWVIVIIFYLLTMISPSTKGETMIKNPMAGVKMVIAGVKNVFATFFKSVNNRIDATINGLANPGQEESRVGIYVEDVKPLDSRYTNESDVFVEAKIVGVNLKESVEVSTVCFINGVKQGTTKPSRLYDVVGEYENYVTCELGKIPAGSYTVKFQAVFEFEGSSDIEYTFVNSELRSDQYALMGIDPNTIATYSGGPVGIGLTSLTQPLRVSPDRNNADLYNYKYGISLENHWTQGKVSRGIGYILDTPSEIKLEDCNRDFSSFEEPDPATGRNIYRFTMDNVKASESFDAISCRMKIDDVNALLASDKNVRTFAGRAKYEYVIEGTTQLVVEKN